MNIKISTTTELCEWSTIAAQIIETSLSKAITPEMWAQIENDAINKPFENWGKWVGKYVKFNLSLKQARLVGKNLSKLCDSHWHIEHNGIKYQLPIDSSQFEMGRFNGKFGEYVIVQFCFFVLSTKHTQS